MTHLDLFSGIGGFALAARWAGLQTVQFVEIDPFCQKVLQKNFPGVPIHDDITTYTQAIYVERCEKGQGEVQSGGSDERYDKYSQTRPFILTGGFPCQPFSCAGKRRGKEDDRYLWPEMLRVVSEAKPTWIIGENVAGFINMGLDDCISDLENEGYEVQAFIIPACAVNAPHRRDRVWIVGHAIKPDMCGFDNGISITESIGCGVEAPIKRTDRHAPHTQSREAQPTEPGGLHAESCGTDRTIRDTDKPRTESIAPASGSRHTISESNRWGEPWLEAATRLCRVDARVSNRMDRLKSLGNAIVPQVAYEIIRAMLPLSDKNGKKVKA
jgi:DNA (cytosine-5)-methyltransferase 1